MLSKSGISFAGSRRNDAAFPFTGYNTRPDKLVDERVISFEAAVTAPDTALPVPLG